MTINEKAQIKEIGDSVQVKQIKQCARCGGTHEHVVFHRFTEPIIFNGSEFVYNYWTMCPVLNEPIIMGRVKDNE